jgi:trimethylguanosine synthase
MIFLQADVVFLGPSRIGPIYKQLHRFRMSDLYPLDGFQVFEAAKRISKNIIYYLPYNADIDQVST